MNETGIIIQEKRIQAGFTQKTLAEALHVTDKAISKWERGICLPDTSLLPKLALLLDTDIDVLISKSIDWKEWAGLISISGCDLSQTVYDKPLVYYLLSHYLLLGVTNIHFKTDERNREFLKSKDFKQYGLSLFYEEPTDKNILLINHPWFIFGSNLTEQLQGAMLSSRTVKLVPENQDAILYCIPKEKNELIEDFKTLEKKSSVRTLGRGMVVFDMSDLDKCLDVASFVRTYQNSSGMLIGSLEEIAYRKGVITDNQLTKMISSLSYGEILEKILVNHKSIEATR